MVGLQVSFHAHNEIDEPHCSEAPSLGVLLASPRSSARQVQLPMSHWPLNGLAGGTDALWGHGIGNQLIPLHYWLLPTSDAGRAQTSLEAGGGTIITLRSTEECMSIGTYINTHIHIEDRKIGDGRDYRIAAPRPGCWTPPTPDCCRTRHQSILCSHGEPTCLAAWNTCKSDPNEQPLCFMTAFNSFSLHCW